MRWRLTGVLLVFLVIVFGTRCALRLRAMSKMVALPDAVAPAPSADQGPPCVHETCAERPKYITCLTTTPCTRWEVLYEHHCDCDRWAPAPDAGGVP